MELRRHKDILALRMADGQTLALHARNLQVAEISPEAWELMPQVALNESLPVFAASSSSAAEELEFWNQEEDSGVTEDRTKFGIRSLTINVTQICNLHCTYCAAGGDGTYGDAVKKISIEKTLPQIRFFLDQIPPGEHFHIAFLGGEPLLYPDALRALGEYTLEESKKRGITASFKVTTNGTLINDKAIEALAAIGCNVTVSLDGPAETNDLQRVGKNGKGTFEDVMKGLNRLIENKSRIGSLGLHAVFNEKNLSVEKTWRLFSALPVDHMEFTYTVSQPDSKATAIFNTEIATVARLAWEKGGEAELLRIANFGEIFERLDNQRRRMNHCGLGKNLMVVDARNKLWSCPWTVGIKGNQLGEGTVLDDETLAPLQRSQIETNGCGTCWARFLCGGGCSFIHGSTNGSLESKKIDFCERTRYLIGLAMVYYHRSRAA
jgi:uncharacterized protein